MNTCTDNSDGNDLGQPSLPPPPLSPSASKSSDADDEASLPPPPPPPPPSILSSVTGTNVTQSSLGASSVTATSSTGYVRKARPSSSVSISEALLSATLLPEADPPTQGAKSNMSAKSSLFPPASISSASTTEVNSIRDTIPHSTSEEIPTLDSAPNSFGAPSLDTFSTPAIPATTVPVNNTLSTERKNDPIPTIRPPSLSSSLRTASTNTLVDGLSHRDSNSLETRVQNTHKTDSFTSTNPITPSNPEVPPLPKLPKRITTLATYPKYSTLSIHQRHVPILLVSTSTSRELVWNKNFVTLEELFGAMANSISTVSPSLLGLRSMTSSSASLNSGDGNALSMSTTSLLPFRSVQRSIGLNFDSFHFQFHNSQNHQVQNVGIDSPSELKAMYQRQEKELSCSAVVLDEDFPAAAAAAAKTSAKGGVKRRPSTGGVFGLNDLEHHVQDLLVDKSGGFSSSSKHTSSIEDPTPIRTQNPDDDFASSALLHSQNIQKQAAEAAFQLVSSHDTPWSRRFRSTMDSMTSLLPHDMLNCPPVIIYVACTSDGMEGSIPSSGTGNTNVEDEAITGPSSFSSRTPIDCLVELSNDVHHLPRSYMNGLYDIETIRKEYIVLHDQVDGPVEFKEGPLLQEMHNRFGPGCCTVLRLNSTPPKSQQGEESGRNNSEEEIVEEDGVWDEFIPPSSGHKPTSVTEVISNTYKIRGCCLSAKDKVVLRRYLGHMITVGLIPALERRILNLNIAVNNSKKGMKNVLKSFWRKPKGSGEGGGISGSSTHGGSTLGNSSHGRKERSLHGVGGGVHYRSTPIGGVDTTNKSSAEGSNDLVTYRYDTIESQTRLLADTLFLVSDYDSALSMYRLIKDDYRQDQSFFHYASVHEMMALCLYMIDQQQRPEQYHQQGGSAGLGMITANSSSKREIVQNIETALYLYTRAAEQDSVCNEYTNRPTVASSATRCVTRLCLVLSSLRSLCEDRHMETADLLASASSGETPLCAAVLLEQSSAHYYRAGMYRKFAFHMLMAGHMFRSANQEQHAIRCFTSAMHAYYNGGNRRWSELYNHLTSALAGQLYSMKRMSLSLQLYAKLVGTNKGGRVSVRSQQKFVDHLIEICKTHEKEAMQATERMKLLGSNNNKGRGASSSSNPMSTELEGIVKSNHDAIEILEIPNMNLPQILDTTVRVEDEMSSLQNTAPLIDHDSPFGIPGKGKDSVWDEMACAVQADLNVLDNPALQSSSSGSMIDNVIRQIDDEKSKLLSRSSRIRNKIASPEVRARMEPISVTFTMLNPLSIVVPISSMQLVATMRCSDTNKTFTNIGAIHIREEGTMKERQWTFDGTSKVFLMADFSRLSTDDKNYTSPLCNEEQPCFVVDKANITLDPSAKITMKLCLCPLVSGDLDIVGFRCKIFDSLWVYHEFNVSRLLVQNSSQNRDHQGRSGSILLKSKIECEMPKINVDLITNADGKSGTVLQGQLNKWILRVSNKSSAAAAGNILLKTNVPWIKILDEGNHQHISSESGKGALFCVGPSGTLLQLPIRHNIGSALNPGETVDIPIEVKTSGGGKQDFYMLFRYELMGNASKSTPKFRWLRKMLSVAVYPSLTMTASLMPSYWNKLDHILSLEMTNYRSDAVTNLEIDLNEISVASRNYVIKPLIGEENDPYEEQKEECISNKLGWQEQVTVHYLISPIEKSIQDDCAVSHCSVKKNLEDINSRASNETVTDFICLENAHDNFTNALQSHRKEQARIETEEEMEGQHPRSIASIRRSKQDNLINESDNTANGGSLKDNKDTTYYHPTSLASLCSSNGSSEINVICSWSTIGSKNDKIVKGKHHLRQLHVRPQYTSKGCPLTITAKYDSVVSHDFTLHPLNIDMEITIRNRLMKAPVDFEFSLSDDQNDISFVGAEKFKWKLNGDDQLVFPLSAIIFSGGVFDLQRTKITVKYDDGTETPYVFPLQWIVKVNTE